MEGLLSDLSLSRSTSIEETHGFQLVDGVPLTPPLVPTTSPASPPPAPLTSPAPAPLASPPTRTAPNWTDDELELAIGLFYRFGPKFRRIARHVAGRSEDAVRQALKRRPAALDRAHKQREQAESDSLHVGFGLQRDAAQRVPPRCGANTDTLRPIELLCGCEQDAAEAASTCEQRA